MPIYEFYCADCHAGFNFLARKPDTKERPKSIRPGPQSDSEHFGQPGNGTRWAETVLGGVDVGVGEVLLHGDADWHLHAVQRS